MDADIVDQMLPTEGTTAQPATFTVPTTDFTIEVETIGFSASPEMVFDGHDKFAKYCARKVEKHDFCKVFELCHFRSKKLGRRCPKTCEDTLGRHTWPCQGCDSRLQLKENKRGKAKVCKGKKDESKCVELVGEPQACN